MLKVIQEMTGAYEGPKGKFICVAEFQLLPSQERALFLRSLFTKKIKSEGEKEEKEEDQCKVNGVCSPEYYQGLKEAIVTYAPVVKPALDFIAWEKTMSSLIGLENNKILRAKWSEMGYLKDYAPTSLGVKLLFKDTADQIWDVAHRYMEMRKYPKSLVRFFCEANMQTCEPENKDHVDFLKAFGFLDSAGKSTSLASYVAIPPCRKQPTEVKLTIDTTMQVTCYSASRLYERIMAMFCTVDSCFGDAILARVSREKTSQLFRKGISSVELLAYLKKLSQEVRLPDTVSDTIHIWYESIFRITFSEPGATYCLGEEFDKVCQDLGDKAMWKSPQTKQVFVANSDMQLLKERAKVHRDKRMKVETL